MSPFDDYKQIIQQEFTEKLVTYLIEGDIENFKLSSILSLSSFKRLYDQTLYQAE